MDNFHNGNGGQRILTNSVRFRFMKDSGLFFKYALKFSPELSSPIRRTLLLQQFHKVLGKRYLFDDLRNTLYLPQSIQMTLKSTKEDDHDRVFRLSGGMPYFEDRKVVVEFRRISVTATACSKDTHAFLTVLQRRGFELLGLEKFGDGVYDTMISLPKFQIDIRSGIRFGTRENNLAPMLWIESSSLVTRSRNLLHLLSSSDETGEYMKDCFERSVVSKMIRTPTRTKAFYPVHQVCWDLNPLSTFQLDGEQKRFVDYYFEQFGIKITDLKQPLLVTKCGKRSKPGKNNLYECRDPKIEGLNHDMIIHVPELCFGCDIIKEAKYNTKMSEAIQKYVNPSPQKMVCILKSYLSALHSNQNVRQLFLQWNVELEESFVEVTGNLLPGPTIVMNPSTKLDFRNTVDLAHVTAQLDFWKMAGRSSFHSSIPLLHWALVCTDDDKPLAIKFAEAFTELARNLGLEHVAVKSIYAQLPVDSSQATDVLATSFVNAIRRAEKNVQLIFFIIPRGSHSGVYQAVKNVCTVELGVPSQGILAKSILSKSFGGVLRSVAIQICSKLGGAPWALDCSNDEDSEAIMTVGIDAYHSRTRLCSVYAAVFTLNTRCTKYYTRTVRQYPGLETGDTLTTMFFDAYVEFYKECGRWPSRVIVFRDGVSNMYLGLIEAHEVAQMKRSLELLKPRPKLTVVLVQKYTTDRLMLLHGESILNPMPGTVVDSTITRTDYQDFFIFSQMSRGKVSLQPTRCVVLEDESNDFESIKKATYASSFTYFNWPGSIRIPAVCQYAHKAAGFVGYVLKGSSPSEGLENKLYYL